MMKFVGFVSLFLVCVLILHVVDGRKHHHKRGKKPVRSDVGKQDTPKVMRKAENATKVILDAVNGDNKATTENKDKAVVVADSQKKSDEHHAHVKHRRGHKGREGHHFRRKDEGKHNHKRGFRKRNHGDKKRDHSVHAPHKKDSLQKRIKNIMKRMKHLRWKKQKKDSIP